MDIKKFEKLFPHEELRTVLWAQRKNEGSIGSGKLIDALLNVAPDKKKDIIKIFFKALFYAKEFNVHKRSCYKLEARFLKKVKKLEKSAREMAEKIAKVYTAKKVVVLEHYDRFDSEWVLVGELKAKAGALCADNFSKARELLTELRKRGKK